MVTADGATTAYVAFGGAGTRVGPSEPGCVKAKPGQSGLVVDDLGLWTNQRNQLAKVIDGSMGVWSPAFLAK